MNRLSTIFDLFAFGEDFGALRVVFNAMAKKELLNSDVDKTVDYLKKVYNRTEDKETFLLVVVKEKQVNVQIETVTGVIDTKVHRDVDSHLASNYNEYVRVKGVHYWTL